VRRPHGPHGPRGPRADAIRFAIEELPQPLLLGAYIEISESRLDHQRIRALYDSADFPQKKKQKVAA
jgi:hypothetical protein